MAENTHILTGVPDSFIDRLSTADLSAIADNTYDRISPQGMSIINEGKTNLGAGEMADTATGIAGAVAGTALGTPGGPVGMFVGGVVGGAVGTYAGEVIEDVVAGRGLNLGFGRGGAAREASISGAIDLGTAGVFKGFKFLKDALHMDSSSVLNIFRQPPPTPPPMNQVQMRDLPVRSNESVLQTQDFLMPRGGTLFPSQTGAQGRLGAIGESIANVGSFSSNQMQGVIENNARIISDSFNQMIRGVDPALARSQEGVGAAISQIVGAAETDLKSYFKTSLDAIKATAGNNLVPVDNISRAIDSIFEENTNRLIVNLSDNTKNMLRKSQKALGYESLLLNPATNNPFKMAKNAGMSDLIEYQQRLTLEISNLRPSINNPMGDAAAYRELSMIENEVKASIADTMARINPDAAAAYRALNKQYGETLNNLYPPLVESNLVRAGEIGAYAQLGRMMTTSSDASKLNAVMNSIDTAFAQFNRSGGQILGDITTPERARALISQSYLANTFAANANGTLDIYKIKGIADELSEPTTAMLYRTVLGSNYNNFKGLVNALENSSQGVSQDFLSLSIRGREISTVLSSASITGSLAGAAGYATMGPEGAMLGAVGIFGIPYVLAKVATNPEATRRLILLASGVNKGAVTSPSFITAQAMKVLEALPEEDRNDIRDMGYTGY
jgi:hypothetical protein